MQTKVLQVGFFWPTMFRDVYQWVKSCDPCQITGKATRRNEMPQQGILEVELFDVWGVYYVGPHPTSQGYRHILVAVDYVSKWVEAVPIVAVDSKLVWKLFKEVVFPRFGIPRVVISDWGAHFNNYQQQNLFRKYGSIIIE
jgi:hypothetical protein